MRTLRRTVASDCLGAKINLKLDCYANVSSRKCRICGCDVFEMFGNAHFRLSTCLSVTSVRNAPIDMTPVSRKVRLHCRSGVQR